METYKELLEGKNPQEINGEEILRVLGLKTDKDRYWVVTKRNTKGMRGKQDGFSMFEITQKGKIIKQWGSHPSLDGALSMGQNRGYGGVISALKF